jgi:hypothetical protein
MFRQMVTRKMESFSKLAGAKVKPNKGSNALKVVGCENETQVIKHQEKQLNWSILVTGQCILKVTAQNVSLR